MIMPIVVDLEVDATLGDGFYYYCFFHSQKELELLLFLKKAINGCGI